MVPNMHETLKSHGFDCNFFVRVHVIAGEVIEARVYRDFWQNQSPEMTT